MVANMKMSTKYAPLPALVGSLKTSNIHSGWRMKLNCDNQTGYPRIWEFWRLLEINTSTLSILVKLEKADVCYAFERLVESKAVKYSADLPKLGKDTEELTLFSHCPKNNPTRNYNATFLCADNETYYFDNLTAEVGNNCRTNFTIWVSKAALDEFTENRNGRRSLRDVLEAPFLVNYSSVNVEGCSQCQKSGGVCGSSVSSQSSDVLVCYRPGKRNLGLILGLGITGAASIIIAIIAFGCRKKLKFGHSNRILRRLPCSQITTDLKNGNLYFGVPLFSYEDLKDATNNFHESRELGHGGFGTVFYGKLRDGREVAVKQLYEKSYKRIKQFMNEVQILTRLRHQNLVSLYGCSSTECSELLLVYEYIRNGTLADHLHGEKSKRGNLSWTTRMKIAIEIATALSYLHASGIIHRDVKTNNILLDESFNIKVADFGLSRLFPTDVTHVSTAPQGTPGYVDPEYHQFYQLTVKSDVYSFGVVLVELMSSLPAVDMNRERQEINLSNYAMSRIKRGELEELVDPRLGFGSDLMVKKMSVSVAEVVFQCLQHDKEMRPAMDEVLEMLKRIQNDDGVRLLKCRVEQSHEEEGCMNLRSPICVMDEWESRSTTIASNSSKPSSDLFYSIN